MVLCSLLLPQQVGTPNGSGHDCRSLTDRRSDGAQPCRQSACPGPLGPAELMQDLTGLADMAMTQREPGNAPVNSSSPTPLTVPDHLTDQQTFAQ